MKKLMILALVVLGAVAVASFALACDKAQTADGKDKAGCNHAKTDTAEASGCTHGAEKTELAKYEDQAGGCPFHSRATDSQRAALLKGEKVTLVGEVICASCDLKQEKACRSVFRTADGKVFSIVGNDAFDKLATQTRHGEKKVEVVAMSAKDAEGPILLLESYKLVG